jgi:hypothetical protein
MKLIKKSLKILFCSIITLNASTLENTLKTYNSNSVLNQNYLGITNKNSSFIIGTGISYLYWYAYNEVKDEDKDGHYGDVDYDISSTYYKSIYFQGYINNKSLALTYLENRDPKYRKTSNIFSGWIDLSNSMASNTRIMIEKANISGTAKFNKNNYKDDFMTKFLKISLLFLNENGKYKGIEYAKYSMPSLLGFKVYKGSTVFIEYDKSVTYRKISYIVGNDSLQKIKVNQKDYVGWFRDYLLGAGLVYVAPTNMSLYKEKAKENGYDGVTIPLGIALDGEIKSGFIIQKKSKIIKNGGFSFQIGFKVRGAYMTGIDSKEGEKNKLSINFDRYDIWYGPFITLNMLF